MPQISQHLPSEMLGLPPDPAVFAQGPLTLAALGGDADLRTVRFHLSALSCNESGEVGDVDALPSDAETRALATAFQRLETSRLRVWAGSRLDHALLWDEGSLDLRTYGPNEALGMSLASVLPQGDGEPMLRRFIEDSVDLLSGLEINQVRIDKGLTPINVLLPWGQGLGVRLPNLALQRGHACSVVSDSIRMLGAAKLAGYSLAPFDTQLGRSFNTLGAWIWDRSNVLMMWSQTASWQGEEAANRKRHAMKRFDTVLQPLVEASLLDRLRLLIACPSATGDGLALNVDTVSRTSSVIPFDERALDESRVPDGTLWRLIDEVLTCEDLP